MKRIIALILMLAMVSVLFCSCGDKDINKNLNTSENITLNVCGPWTEFKALETVAQKFHEKYPNCTVVYEYMQDYDKSVVTRLEQSPETIDIFLPSSTNNYIDYSLELFSQPDLDLSDTNEALIKNFTYKDSDPDAPAKIYSIPLGGELRGMYVNKTLLATQGLSVPTNAAELLSACETLKNAGYIPMNLNPGMFAQRLVYPYVCNLIANSDNYEETYAKVDNCEPGVSELFRQPMQFLYELVDKGYYNYKYVESELKMFTDNSDEGTARYFFNIKEDGDSYVKVDDVGTVAFISGTLAQGTSLEKTKQDYHSEIDYEFVLAPVSDEGGFAYLSPGRGIAINKNSLHTDWAVEFFDFLFSKDINVIFAAENNYIPNTSNALDLVREMYKIPENRISDLGQATFSYDFYKVVNTSLVEVSKGNNPKYMNTDENGNTVMYSFDYYMDKLEASFAQQRESRSQS